MDTGSWTRTKVLFAITLLVMILMRLVWMNLRTYPELPSERALISLEFYKALDLGQCNINIEASTSLSEIARERLDLLHDQLAWLVSPAYVGFAYLGCLDKELGFGRLLTWSQWALMATAFLCVLLARFLTSSWMISLTVGAVVLSRGALMTRLSFVSIDAFVMFFTTLWMSCFAHFLRTGSTFILTLAVVTVAIASLFDFSFAFVGLALPLLLTVAYVFRKKLAAPVMIRLREEKRRKDSIIKSRPSEAIKRFGFWDRTIKTLRRYIKKGLPGQPKVEIGNHFQRGGLFQTIDIPFAVWAYHLNRWRNISLGWGLVTVGIVSFNILFILLLASSYGKVESLDDLVLRAVSYDYFDWIWIKNWLATATLPIDLHYIASIVIICFCALQSPADGLVSFLEAVWLFLIASCMLLLASFAFDFVDFSLFVNRFDVDFAYLMTSRFQRQPLYWIEPIVLTFGIAGLYNLVKVVDSRLRRKH